jgi:hypothetical protein
MAGWVELVGIEREKEYCEVAKRRIVVNQRPLFGVVAGLLVVAGAEIGATGLSGSGETTADGSEVNFRKSHLRLSEENPPKKPPNSAPAAKLETPMTHIEDSKAVIVVVELLAENGFEGMAEAMQILFNEAMKIQGSTALGAEPYERSDARRGHANGFKPFSSRLGRLNLQIPQTRGVEFYPSALERGERSERALKLAIAEMYVQRVSTRKVAAITCDWSAPSLV